LSGITFSLDLRHTANRRIPVALELAVQATGEIELFFPTWTPGSYLIREFARNLSDLRASREDGESLPIDYTAKNRWRVRAEPGARIRLSYSIHAHELTVRTAHADSDHAYWNGACVYLWPLGQEHDAATIHVDIPESWGLATQLEQERTGNTITLHAENLDAAIDAPCLAGVLDRLPFEVLGIPHEAVFWGMGGIRVPDEFIPDTRRIIEEAAKVFGGVLPYERYTFLSLHADSGGGGLEHTESSTLLAPRTTFAPRKSYLGFMGLVAHEHFHVWNIKRMRPEEFWTFDYERENHTELLWVAEGFTAYYDELLCLRAGIHDPESYLETVAQSIDSLASNPGRELLSLSRSSFDAWIRLYRADADTRNTSQNYYTNGALAAMVLDLTIRAASGGERSLDDAVRRLWQSTWEEGRGYTRNDVDRCLSDAAGEDLSALVASLVDGPFDPDFAPLLEQFGIAIRSASRAAAPYLGMTLRKSTTTITQVVAGGPADVGGLCPGDEILGMGGLRAAAEGWEALFDAVASPERPLEVLVSRLGVLTTCIVRPGVAPSKIKLAIAEDASPGASALRTGWLGQ